MFDFPEINQMKPAPALADLPGASLRLLLYITEAGGEVIATKSKLAEVCFMTDTTAHQALRKLKNRNLIKMRAVGRDDERLVYQIRRVPDNLIDCEVDEESGAVVGEG